MSIEELREKAKESIKNNDRKIKRRRRSKYTEEDLREVFTLILEGYTYSEVQEKTGMPKSTISRMVNNNYILK